MTRKKVNLGYISNDIGRKSTFLKRRKSLMKKIEELSVLCDLEACAVIYDDKDVRPTTWPDYQSAVEIVEKFNKLPPVEQTVKRVNLEDFLREGIEKLKTKNEKIRRECYELEMNSVIMECIQNGKSIFEFDVPDLDDMLIFLECKLDSMKELLETLPSTSGGDSH